MGKNGTQLYHEKQGCSVFHETKYYLSHVIAEDIPPEISFDCTVNIMNE
jgi:hypothetical protein